MTKMRARRIVVFAVGFAAASHGWDVVASQPPFVGLNTLEYAYISFANNLASAAPRGSFRPGPDVVPAAVSICEKINPRATTLSASWGGFEGWSFSYAQAECFYQVAVKAKAIEVCDRVREVDETPPRPHLSEKRERRLTRAECRDEASRQGGGGGEFGTEVMLALLGYTAKDRAAAAGDRGLDEFDAYEFKSYLFDGHGDDGQDYSTLEDLLRRVPRLPDFSKGDEPARRQIDTLMPGWSSPANQERAAVLLRCYLGRLGVGEAMAARCD
jgi:hypothetical protein